MAANKTCRFGPVAIPASLANLLNPGTTTGGVNMPATSGNLYFIVKHIRIVNKSASPVTVSLYVGATGVGVAGTEFMGNGLSVPANSFIDWYGLLRLDVADFLVGIAGTVTTLVFEAEGEVGVN